MAVSTIGSGGDYSTLDLWEAALSGTFTADEVGALFDENFTPSGTLSFGGFTTANTGRLVIRAATAGETGGSAAKHNGLAGTGARITKTNGGTWGVFYSTDNNVKHVEIHDIELYSNGSANLGIHIANAGFDDLMVSGCLFYDFDLGAINANQASGSGTVRIWNCFAWNLGTGAGGIEGNSGASGRVECYHVTLVRQSSDADVGRTGIRYCIVKNCAVFHYGPTGGHADFLDAGTGSNYNASSDTSSPGANSLDSVTASDQFTSVGGTWDLHLKSGSDLEAAGTPIGSVTDDIDDAARDGTTPDIGADEFSSGGTNLTIVAATQGHTADPSNFAANLTVVSDTQGHTVAAPAQVQNYTLLDGANAEQGHTATPVVLTQALEPIDADQGHTVGAPGLTQLHLLFQANATQGHTSDPIILVKNLVVGGPETGHTAAAIAMTQIATMELADAVMGHEARPVNLNGFNPSVASAIMGHVADPTQTITASYADAMGVDWGESVSIRPGLCPWTSVRLPRTV
jgi:hypothetical protein